MKPVSEMTDEDFKNLEPGIYYDIPFDKYLLINAFSKSGVKEMLKSPMHYQYYRNNPKESDAMALGSLVDCMLLEPETFDSLYMAQPETFPKPVKVKKDEKPRTTDEPWNNKSPICRAYRDELIKRTGKIILDPEKMAEANGIIENIKKSVTASELLVGRTQVTMVWYDQATGVKCKGRPDVMGEGFLTDLKTSKDASEKDFRYTMLKFKYHVQAAMYQDGMCVLQNTDVKLPFYFVVGETTAPYGVGCYHIREESIATGRKEYREALVKYKEAAENDLWEESYVDDVVDLDIPPYAINRDLVEEDYE